MSWSSIEDALRTARIREDFAALTALAEQLERRGRPLAASEDGGWVPVSHPPCEVFPLPGCRSPRELAAALAEHWRREGLPELAEHASALGHLAERLRGGEAVDGELPPLLYTLF